LHQTLAIAIIGGFTIALPLLTSHTQLKLNFY
jgi:hypothetical protein